MQALVLFDINEILFLIERCLVIFFLKKYGMHPLNGIYFRPHSKIEQYCNNVVSLKTTQTCL